MAPKLIKLDYSLGRDATSVTSTATKQPACHPQALPWLSDQVMVWHRRALPYSRPPRALCSLAQRKTMPGPSPLTPPLLPASHHLHDVSCTASAATMYCLTWSP